MRIQVLGVVLLLLVVALYADGLIIPPRPDDSYPIVLNHYVNVTVEDTRATFYVDQEFENDGYRDIEGTYVFPVPAGSIRNFQIVVDGKVVEGRMLGKEEAQNLYQQYVRERGDASLLEYSGQETFSAKVYLKRKEHVRVQISYEQVISESSGVYSVFYPLSPERYSTRIIDPVDIRVKIKAAGNIGFILSPTHNVSISRRNGSEAEVTYYSKEIPDRDFQVLYGVTKRDYDVKAIANKKSGKDGYFMLFVYPSSPSLETAQKDVVYVIDVSGSMQGTKLEQAKRALKYGLDKLGENDRFNIIAFSSETSAYQNGLVGSGSTADAKGFVESLEASGSTNIEDALVLAAKQFSDDDRVHLIVFLSDGDDTTGHSTRSIMEAVKGCTCRIFPFGVGADVDFELLDRLSNEYGDGIPIYIRSDSELESSLLPFYDKIAKPLLTDVKVTVSGDGITVYDIYPRKVPDIFYGSQIALAGRYSGSGQATVKVNGKLSGEEKSFEYSVELPETGNNQFAERTWAVRKVGYLLDVITLEGETAELREQVTALAKQYGIPSPYTSYVAVNQHGEQEERALDVSTATGGWGGMGNAMTVASTYKSAESYSYTPPETKNVDDKTFVNVGGVWRDTACGENVDSNVDFGTKDYFALASDTQVARYLSVGTNVQLCTDKSVMVTGQAEKTASPVPTYIPGVQGITNEVAGPGRASAPTNQTGGDWVSSLFWKALPFGILVLFGIGVVLSVILGRPHEMQMQREVEDETHIYKTLSSETRVDILKILHDGEGGRTPSFISEKLGKSKATISEHLDKLVEAQLVEKEEVEGRKWVFYRITPKGKAMMKKGG